VDDAAAGGPGRFNEVRAVRFAAQRLDRLKAGDVAGLVRHMLAVQAQDPSAFPLALRARGAGLTAKDLAAARDARTVVRCWGPRGTLHLIATDDLGWFYPLVKPAPAGSLRRLRQLGVDADAEAVLAAVEVAMRGQGPLTKTRLGERLADAGLPAAGQAIVHAALLGAGRGLVVLGPERDTKPTYVHAADWLGAPLPVEVADRDTAIRTLVARYRAAHDPCTPADLAAWSGLPRGELDRAWHPVSADRVAANLPSVRLIPAFDEYLLGWRSRDHAVPEAFRRLIHPGGGIIKSAVLVDGLTAGTWTARRTASRIDIAVEPFAPFPADATAAIAAEAADIGTFLDLDARLTMPPSGPG
jgi:hypothetical protein